MNGRMRELVRRLAPPITLDLYRQLRGRELRFEGDYASWSEARKHASGYDSEVIVEQVANATRTLLAGGAAFERDSVLFAKPEYPYALIAGLLLAASRHHGELEVIDFGGSLGSLYRQCQPFIADLRQLNWRVVEQPIFVERGKREFETEQLTFSDTLPIGVACPAVVLASSVLQYLDDPHAVLQQFERTGASHLIIDRTPLSEGLDRNQLCVQRVPAHIYDASYPCWIFSRKWLDAALSKGWRLVAEFPGFEGRRRTRTGTLFEYRGLIMERRD